ncbi:LytR/AlgR family response regulator transcription factor [Arabiibacter massiliensis]|uniref:LytR/AlgR family response regulator transcription factor n=1 Tax=Arabiibacter massiliensis TaxID=1870985 RepID=UPI0009B94258|nr:LytTR family DNA-binding domain-containing protein [Arabiibacter massiliensis]
MRIAIVEDCARDAEALERALADHLDRRGHTADILRFESGEALFAESAEAAFDLIFLDVYLNDETGIQIAERLRRERQPGLIVFITISAEHAVDGFRLRAFHYLTKPCAPEDVASVVDEALERLSDEETVLRIRDGSAVANVPLSQVLYVTTDGHYLSVVTTSGTLRWRQPFSRLAELVAPYRQFYVCSRSDLVNMDHAESFTRDGCFLMDDGAKMPVRKSSRAEARNRYFDCLFSRVQA